MQQTPIDPLVEVHEEDGEYVAIRRDLDIAGQGPTPEAAVADVNEAVQMRLETASDTEIRERLPRRIA